MLERERERERAAKLDPSLGPSSHVEGGLQLGTHVGEDGSFDRLQMILSVGEVAAVNERLFGGSPRRTHHASPEGVCAAVC